jgi:protocatechuate 3,4-dioxygenase beta subunit
LLACAPTAFTQAPRDVPAATGPIIVTGRVVAGEAAAPLRRVLVSFQADASALPTYTDDDGAFQVVIPRGTGGLRLSKPGYASLSVERRALRTGTQLLVQMARGAAINGVVTDHQGGPAVNIPVRVRRVGANGSFTTETDDLGEFRVGNLEAGRYTVEAALAGGRGRGAVALLGRLTDDRREELRALLEGATASGAEPAAIRQLIEGALISQPGAQANAAPGTADPNGRAGRGGRGGRGRGGRGTTPADPSLPAVDLVEGQEATIALSVDTQTAADLEAAVAAAVPGRPATGSPPTGELRGRVYDSEGRPVRRATVQLTPVGAEGAGRRASTDAGGSYQIPALPPGAYRVRVSKPGLPDVEYGQRRALQAGRIITVRENQRVHGIDVRMPRASAITGRLVDAWGEPIEGASVNVLQASFVDGRATLSTVGGARTRRTDDRGRYRIHSLLPGRYFVVAAEPAPGRGRDDEASARVFYPGILAASAAAPIQVDVGQDAFGIDFPVNAAGAARVEGVAISTVTGEPARGRAVLAVSQRSGEPLLPLQTARVQDDGSFVFTGVSPGDYVVQVQTNTGGRGGEGRAGGRGNAAGARGGNGGRGNVTAPQPAGRAGRGGTGATGATAGAAPQAVGGGAGAPGQVGGGQSGRNGGTLGGRGGAAAAQGGRGARGGVAAATQTTRTAAPSEFGVAYVTVGSNDVGSVRIETAPGIPVRGQLVLEGDASAVSASSFGFAAFAADTDAAPLTGTRQSRADVRPDGTFEMGDLLGPHRFAVTRVPDDWWLKSVTVNGVNAVEFPITFHRGDSAATSVAVTFAQGTGSVEGRVLDDRREPTSDFAVVVFASDPDRWYSRSQYLRFSSPVQDGTFAVTGLPPGEYLVAALDRIDGGPDFGEWQNPVVLNALAASARRIKVAAGQAVTLELRMLTTNQ